MARYKPILKTIGSFDADVDYLNTEQTVGKILNDGTTVRDKVRGVKVNYTFYGDIPKCNKLYVKDEDWNEIYSQTIDVASWNYIPDHVLENGKKYYIQIALNKPDGMEIDTDYISDPITVLTFLTPNFTMDGLSATSINRIETSSLRINLTYNYNPITEKFKKDEIDYAEIFLYDSDMNKLRTSGIIRNFNKDAATDEINTNSIYTFSGLSDQKVYYVKATCTTKHKLVVDTPIYNISVGYNRPSLYSLLKTYEEEKSRGTGLITYESNLKFLTPSRLIRTENGTIEYSILGVEDYYLGTDPEHLINLLGKYKSCVDLTGKTKIPTLDGGYSEVDEYITYTDHINITGDFVVGIRHKFKGIRGEQLPKGTIFSLKNEDGQIIKLSMIEDIDSYEGWGFRYMLTIDDNSIIYSKNPHRVLALEYIESMTVYIYRIGHIYGLNSFLTYSYKDKDFNIWLNQDTDYTDPITGDVEPRNETYRPEGAKEYDVYENTGELEGSIPSDYPWRIVTDVEPHVKDYEKDPDIGILDDIIWFNEGEGYSTEGVIL